MYITIHIYVYIYIMCKTRLQTTQVNFDMRTCYFMGETFQKKGHLGSKRVFICLL